MMKTTITTLLLSLGILITGCDAPEDEVSEDGQAVESEDGGKSDNPANFPSDFPDSDTHCNGVFSSCDAQVRFSTSSWGSLGTKLDEQYRSGDQVVVRAFIEGPDLSGVRARLHFSAEQVSSLSEAQQIAISDITATRTRFDDGMEVEVTANIEEFMVFEGSVDGYFYVAFSGADGTLRAIESELD